MPRIRSIKPEFFTSATVAELSFRAMVTFAGLWVYCDDEGRGRDDPRLIKAVVWPQRDDVTIDDIADDLRELNLAGLIVRYDDTTSGTRGLRRGTGRAPVESPLKQPAKYLCVRSWQEHQRINRKTKSKLPRPPAVSGKLSESSLFSQDNSPQEVGSGSRNREVGSGSGTREGTKPNPKGRVPHEGETNGKAEVSALLDRLAEKKAMP